MHITLDEKCTVATIAEQLTALPIEQQRALALLDPEQASEVGIFPLSYAQQMLWVLEQWEAAGSALYNNTSIIYLRGQLHVATLEHSLNEMLRRHEALRTLFVVLDSQPVQVVTPAARLLLPPQSLEGGLSSADGWHQEVECFARMDARRPFQLAKELPMRITLFARSKKEYALVLTIHHIVSDNWSMGIFMQELTCLYNAFVQGQRSLLEELPIQYADFALWQQSWEYRHRLASQLNYWREQLRDLPQTQPLPMDRPRLQIHHFRGATYWFSFPQRLSQQLEDLSQHEGVTLFMTLLAAWKTLLFRYSQQEDIVVGSPIACRNHVELEGLIGFFVNMLVLRTRLNGEQSFRTLLHTIREVTLEAYGHQEVPFMHIVEALQPNRQIGHSPLFQVVFILQNAAEQSLELMGLDVHIEEIDNGMSRFDLTMSLEETTQGLRGCIEYSTDLFESETISRMCGHFQTLLEGIVSDPEQTLGALPLWSATLILAEEEMASLFDK